MGNDLSEGSKAIIEKIARETAEQYLKITKELIVKEVALHSAQCEIGRLSAAKTAAVAILASAASLTGNWIIGKL
jgi:hypothetical protein